MAKKTNELRLQAKESSKWLLSQPALDNSGKPVEMYGRKLNNMDVILKGLLQSASDGAVSPAMNLLTISGVLREETEEELALKAKRKAESAKKYKSQLKTIKDYITKKLKAMGTYNSSLTFAIEIAAMNILLSRKLAEEVMPDHSSLIITETSREGASRQKPSPLLGELQRQMDKTLASLRDLSMTVKSANITPEPEDELTQILKNFQK